MGGSSDESGQMVTRKLSAVMAESLIAGKTDNNKNKNLQQASEHGNVVRRTIVRVMSGSKIRRCLSELLVIENLMISPYIPVYILSNPQNLIFVGPEGVGISSRKKAP